MGTAPDALNTENAAEKGTLDRSTIRFPYLDQDDSVELARKIFELGGKSCDKIALAAAFNVSSEGGAFGLRLATAKMYGFIVAEKKVVSLTDLGQRVVDPTTEKSARAESLLEVPLYKALYGEYQGQLLPGNDGLEAHIVKLGVAPKQKDKARQVFQRSAKQAGYFSISSNRLAAPQFKQGSPDPPPPATEKPDGSNGGSSGGAGGAGGGGGDDKKRHPFIEGLLDKLPPAETEWTLEGRKKWLQTASNIFDLMYTAPEDASGELSVVYTKDSAK